MTKQRTFLLLLALCALAAQLVSAQEPTLNTAEGAARLFILRSTEGILAVEAIDVGVNETEVLLASEDLVDVVFPAGPGQSAGLVTPGDGRTFVVQNTGQELRVEVRSSDGSSRELPARPLDELVQHDVRLSVTGGGQRAAFLIIMNERVTADVGPVANMFAGRLPAAMLQDAYVVQTETYRHEAGPAISGTATLEIDRWPFVQITLSDGTASDFIVDIGAGGTVVDRSILPEGTEIIEASMVEYSAAGKRTLKYAPGGAAGEVQTIVGHATLEQVVLGDLVVPDVTVDVMESLPDIFGRRVSGILGMDVLRRCELLSLTLATEAPELAFGADPLGAEDAIELPFAFVSTHLVVGGEVNGTPVFFILDTGAPSVFLDETAAETSDVELEAAETDSARGLGEGHVRLHQSTIGTLTLGDRSFDAVPCMVSALAPFDMIRAEGQHAGLLGNDFLGRFDRIEIDFEHRVVRLLP
jgi:predicted aspartyl protease